MIRCSSMVFVLCLLCSCAGIRIVPQQSEPKQSQRAQLPRWVLVNNYQLGGNYGFTLSSSIHDTLSVYSVDPNDASLTYHAGSTDLHLGWGVDAFVNSGWLFYSPQNAAVSFDPSTGQLGDSIKENFQVEDVLPNTPLLVARNVEDKDNIPTTFFTVGTWHRDGSLETVLKLEDTGGFNPHLHPSGRFLFLVGWRQSLVQPVDGSEPVVLPSSLAQEQWLGWDSTGKYLFTWYPDITPTSTVIHIYSIDASTGQLTPRGDWYYSKLLLELHQDGDYFYIRSIDDPHRFHQYRFDDTDGTVNETGFTLQEPDGAEELSSFDIRSGFAVFLSPYSNHIYTVLYDPRTGSVKRMNGPYETGTGPVKAFLSN